MMTKKINRAFWLCLFILFLTPFSLVVANTVKPPAPQVTDERQVEKEREQAVFDALVSVDPAIGNLSMKKVGRAIAPDEQSVQNEVIELRHKRKSQFKSLTWTHIKSVISKESVLAKAKFLDERDKTLNKIIERAVGVYIPAEVARERIGLAKFRIAKAIRDLFPELTFTSDNKHGVLSPLNPYTSQNWRLAFRQPLFRGGVLWNTLLLEWTNMETAKRDYEKTISNLTADISQAYFEFERARNIQNDQVQLFEIAKEQKRISDSKYNSSLISEIEKLNVDSLYSQAQYDLETAQQDLEIARLELQKFLKLEPTDPIDVEALYRLDNLKLESLRKTTSKGVDPTNRTSSDLDTDLNQFVELAYENRPDLQVEASKLKAAQLAYRIAVGRKLPQVDFIYETGELAEAYRSVMQNPPGKKEFRYGVEVTWPFGGNTFKYTYDNDKRAPSVSEFQGQSGTRTAANSFSVSLLDDMGQFASLKEAKLKSLEQVVELEKTERDVVREVKEAYFNFNKAIIQVESAFKRMGYRQRLADVSKHRLDQNEVQISEYLQSRMDYTEERGLVYKALVDFFLSKAKLNRAIGIRDYLSIDALD